MWTGAEEFGFYTLSPTSRKSESWFMSLSREELPIYQTLYRIIAIERNLEELVAYVGQFEDKYQVTEWVNRNLVVVSNFPSNRAKAPHRRSSSITPPAGEGLYYAMNLCHRAVKNGSKELVHFLVVHCGADLSHHCLQIKAESKRDAFIQQSDSVFAMIMNTFHEPPVDFLKHVLNSGVIQSYEDASSQHSRKVFKFDFSVLCPRLHRSKVPQQMNVLNAIVNSSDDLHCAQYELLKHPLIEIFLALKWRHYRKFFLLLVFIYTVFVMSFSVVAHWMSKGYQALKIGGADGGNATFTEQDVLILTVGNGMACFSAAFLFAHAIIQIAFLPSLRKAFWDLELLLNFIAPSGAIAICVCSLVLSFSERHMKFRTSALLEMLPHFASWIVLIVWTNLMLLVGRLPKLGCYSLMLTTVTKNFLKVMTSFIFLVVGFALSFTLIFPTSEFFSSPWNSFVRTVVMMVGEFEYTATYSDSSESMVLGTSRLLFLVFLITCSIILMNLTQGIAVNDIKLLQDISQEVRVLKETRFLYELERVFTHSIVQRNRLLRNLKLLLYDKGELVHSLTVSSTNRSGFPVAFYDMLVREF